MFPGLVPMPNRISNLERVTQGGALCSLTDLGGIYLSASTRSTKRAWRGRRPIVEAGARLTLSHHWAE